MGEWIAVFRRGIAVDDPLTVLLIGLCATLAVSTKVEGALFMGVAVIFVLAMSSMMISSVRRFVPEAVRIPIFIVVIASLALVTFAAFMERLNIAPVPEIMRGTPIAFVTVGLLSMGYVGLSGLFGL